MNKMCRKCRTGAMTETESAQDLNVRGTQLRVAGLRHWECQQCHAAIETPDQLDYNSSLIRAELKRHRAEIRRGSGLLIGEEIKTLRKRFGLTQSQAAQLFGGGPVAFSKYESEDTAQSSAMNRLLQLCLIDSPANIELLAKRYDVALSAATQLAIQADFWNRAALRRDGILAYESLVAAIAWAQPTSSPAANESLYARFERSTRRQKPTQEEILQLVA